MRPKQALLGEGGHDDCACTGGSGPHSVLPSWLRVIHNSFPRIPYAHRKVVSLEQHEIVIVGGGIVGLATALSLLDGGSIDLMVLEAEAGLAQHQTGHNSGVIHSGLYYKPGSLKAKTCMDGREALYRFCREHGVPHEQCGKVVVATDDSQVPALEELYRRGETNGLKGMQCLDAKGLREHEPHVAGVAGLFVAVPDTDGR